MARSKTLVMIHGAFAGGWSFAPMAEFFARRGYRCLTPDLRHHNWHPGTPVPPALGRTSMRDYAQDLMALIDSLDDMPVLIGHSMGGLLAQMIAARRPVVGAVLLGPSPPWGVLPSTMTELMAMQGVMLSGHLFNEPLVPHYAAAALVLNHFPPDERRKIFARLVPESGRAVFEILHWPADLRRTTFVFPRDVKCPLLTLVGKNDAVNPPATVRRVALRYGARSTFLALPDLGHWLIGEPGWERVAEMIAQWLDKTPLYKAPDFERAR